MAATRAARAKTTRQTKNLLWAMSDGVGGPKSEFTPNPKQPFEQRAAKVSKEPNPTDAARRTNVGNAPCDQFRACASILAMFPKPVGQKHLRPWGSRP
jgi:hypothetical protein